MAFTVKSRRGEIGFDVARVRHGGLAALRLVFVAAKRRDLEDDAVPPAAHRPEPLALEPHGIGPTPDQPFDDLGSGIRGQVDVGVRIDLVEEGVSHRTADQVALVAGGGEAIGELAGGRSRLVEASEARGNFHARHSRRARGSYPTSIRVSGPTRSASSSRTISPGAYAAWASASSRVTRPRS